MQVGVAQAATPTYSGVSGDRRISPGRCDDGAKSRREWRPRALWWETVVRARIFRRVKDAADDTDPRGFPGLKIVTSPERTPITALSQGRLLERPGLQGWVDATIVPVIREQRDRRNVGSRPDILAYQPRCGGRKRGAKVVFDFRAISARSANTGIMVCLAIQKAPEIVRRS